MARISFKQFRTIFALVILSSFLVSCSTQATSQYYGVTKAPKDRFCGIFPAVNRNRSTRKFRPDSPKRGF